MADKYGELVYDGLDNVRMQVKFTPDPVAMMAFNMLERWGPVVAEDDGYDEAGRQKIKNMTPADTVLRAFDIAEAAYQEARKRRLLHRITPEMITKMGVRKA